jgi:hypothetical protein
MQDAELLERLALEKLAKTEGEVRQEGLHGYRGLKSNGTKTYAKATRQACAGCRISQGGHSSKPPLYRPTEGPVGTEADDTNKRKWRVFCTSFPCEPNAWPTAVCSWSPLWPNSVIFLPLITRLLNALLHLKRRTHFQARLQGSASHPLPASPEPR